MYSILLISIFPVTFEKEVGHYDTGSFLFKSGIKEGVITALKTIAGI
jgi:hypothetical protein